MECIVTFVTLKKDVVGWAVHVAVWVKRGILSKFNRKT